MRHTILPIIVLLAASLSAAGPYLPTDDERARWTRADLNNWRTVLAAYKADTDHYPPGRSLEAVRKVVEPVYIDEAVMTDAWGRPFRYEKTAEGFRLTSAGPNGSFDGESPDGDDDVITHEGPWTKCSWTTAQ